MSAGRLLDFMIDTVVQVVKEIRHKLLFKACCHFNILTFTRFSARQSQDSDNEWLEDAADPPTFPDEPQVKDYREAAENFDDFIETMWRYLDLINRTSVLLEDFFLLFLTGLDYDRPNNKTIFKHIQW